MLHNYSERGDNVNKQLAYKVNEVAEILGKKPDTIRQQIRLGNIKTTGKCGTGYLIPKKEVDRLLGIETDDESLKKDLEIERLKGKVKSLETQIQAFKSVTVSLNNIVGL